MKCKDLRDAVVEYASKNTVTECAELFEGIVSLNTVYKWLRDSKNLTYAYTHDHCRHELELYKLREAKYTCSIGMNRLVHTFQPHFFDVERELWQDKIIQQKLKENRRKYLNKDTLTDREILRGFKISGIHTGYSHFSPLWLKKYAHEEDVSCIYDPCGGWGHRLIGAYLSDIDYIYNDMWDKTFMGSNTIAKFINYKCTLYNNDCTKFIPQETYDCVFTCPPYYNVERYNGKLFKDIEDYNRFINAMLVNSIKPSVTRVGIVINDTYEQAVSDNMDSSFKLASRVVLGTSAAVSHFNKSTSSKKEVLLKYQR
jgi:hypothetical protein